MNAVSIIVGFTVVVSLYCLSNPAWFQRLSFSPYLAEKRKEWYRFITCAWVHADYMHLAVNMFVLYSFGQFVLVEFEYYFQGSYLIYFFTLYLLGVAFANASTFFKYRHVPAYQSVGASGGVSAVLFASTLFAPWSKVYLFFFFPLPNILAAGAYLVYSWYMARRQTGDNINHEAHFYGAIFGLIYPVLAKPEIGKQFIQLLINR